MATRLKNETEATYAIILEICYILNKSTCDLCHKPELRKRNGKFQRGGSFVIHHHRYLKKNGVIVEKIHSDFKKKNSKGTIVPDRLRYHKYLIKQVRKQPRRFRVFHNKCHFAAEALAKWSPENRRNLYKLANEIYKNNHT